MMNENRKASVLYIRKIDRYNIQMRKSIRSRLSVFVRKSISACLKGGHKIKCLFARQVRILGKNMSMHCRKIKRKN